MRENQISTINVHLKALLGKVRTKDIHLRELISGTTVALFLKIIGIAFGYIFTLLITKNFGADTMGIFALCTTVLSMASILGRFGTDTALLRFVAEYSAQDRGDLVKEVYGKALKIAIPFSISLTIILFFGSPFISKYIFHKEHLSNYFQITSLAILPFVLIFINSQSLRAIKKIGEYSFFQNISQFLFASVFLLVLLIFSAKNSLPVIAYVLAIFTGAILSYILWKKHARLDSSHIRNEISTKDILHVSLPMLLSSSMLMITHWTNTLMLGIFRTEAEVGIFNVAARISTATSFTLIAINTITAPKFAEFYGKRDYIGLEKFVLQSTKIIFWTSFPILLTIIFSPSFILGIFGEEFKAGVFALLILTIGQFISSVSGSVGILLNMTGRHKVFQYIMLTTAFLNVILNAILIPKYGINGAAIVTMISFAFWNLSSVIYIKYSLNIMTLYIPFLVKKTNG
jgi:O-antigen/teichoic acid export membrane protein